LAEHGDCGGTPDAHTPVGYNYYYFRVSLHLVVAAGAWALAAAGTSSAALVGTWVVVAVVVGNIHSCRCSIADTRSWAFVVVADTAALALDRSNRVL
jgi:hypothetical protein